MLVISDTTPIISLLKINRLGLLSDMFEEIIIPDAVYQELTGNSKYMDQAKTISESSFIKTVEVPNDDIVKLLQRATGLDKGESEAIILADEMKADLLLMDELQGRNVAKKMGIQITGTIGLLMEAYCVGMMDKKAILTCIEDLKRTKRFIDESLYQELIRIVDEEQAF